MQLVASAGLVPTSARSLPPFKLHQPRSVAEALSDLADQPGAVLLAGGSDLVAAFNEGLTPSALVSLKRVSAVHQVSADDSGLRIGAAITHGMGCSDPLLRAQAPGFAAAWSSIANPRIRFTGTLGGNLMAGRPRYEGAVLLSAAQARLEFASLTGVQTIQVPDLSSSLLQASAPAFQQPRLLTHIHLPTTDLVSYFYERSMRPLMTLAAALRLRGDGLQLCVAVATEYLKPALLLLPLRAYALADVARQARAIALDAFAQLPADFADPVITCDCARAAGTALLARRLERLAGLAHV